MQRKAGAGEDQGRPVGRFSLLDKCNENDICMERERDVQLCSPHWGLGQVWINASELAGEADDEEEV